MHPPQTWEISNKYKISLQCQQLALSLQLDHHYRITLEKFNVIQLFFRRRLKQNSFPSKSKPNSCWIPVEQLRIVFSLQAFLQKKIPVSPTFFCIFFKVQIWCNESFTHKKLAYLLLLRTHSQKMNHDHYLVILASTATIHTNHKKIFF